MSAIGFGAWEISIESEEVRAVEAIRAGVAAGMTWVNTAEMYGMGRGEEIVGLALADFPSVLAITKIWHGVHGTLTRDVVRAAAEASLRRLGRQAIDLYEVLEPDPALPLEGVWEAMAALVDAGLAHQIGVCNFSLEQVSRCERVRHVDAVENQFSLLHREEHEVLSEHCARAGTAFIAYGPLALGLLTGKIDAGRSYAETSWGRGKTEEQLSLYQRSLFGREVVGIHLGYVERLRPLAARAGLPLAQLAPAWVTQQDDFTVAIAGSTSPENTRQNAAAGSIDLPRLGHGRTCGSVGGSEPGQ
jgi:aryl-alcohol dehydrogenase-like predicted oxidoreductase